MYRLASRSIPTAALVVLALGLGPAAPAAADREKLPPPEELVNFLLGPDLSQWLVGPIYLIATPAERRDFLTLGSDADAQRFIEEFWRRRDPEPDIFGNPVRDLYEQRVGQADRRFREQLRRGRSTDRGVIYTLYGEPGSIEFDTSVNPREPDLEVWIYPAEAPAGLDGEMPARRYYFAEKNGETVLYTPRATRRITIRQQRGGR